MGAATAVKQLERLKKEAAKTEVDAAKAETDLAARKDEHKVLSGSLLSYPAQMCPPPVHRCLCILTNVVKTSSHFKSCLYCTYNENVHFALRRH